MCFECVFVEADSSWDGPQSHASPDRGTRGRRWKPANENPAWLPSPPELLHLSYPDPDGESASSKPVTAVSDVMSCIREGPSVVLVSRVPRLRPPRASLQLQAAPGNLISLHSFFFFSPPQLAKGSHHWKDKASAPPSSPRGGLSTSNAALRLGFPLVTGFTATSHLPAHETISIGADD